MTQWISEILNHFQKDSWLAWSVALVLALLVSFGVKLVLNFLIPKVTTWTTNTHGWWDDLLVGFLQGFKFWVVFIIIFNISVHIISSNLSLNKVSQSIMILAISWQVALWIMIAVKIWKNKFLEKKLQTNHAASSAINLMFSAIQAVIILIVVLIALSNIGIDVNAMVASLGIGGIAIALAVQNILGDLFGSVTIVLDKPFVVGDYITVGTDSGVVENIGVKTTRVRAVSGEELIFANKDLLENRIHNFKRMSKRRVEKRVSILRDKTNISRISEVSTWIEEYLKKDEKVSLEYCRLVGVDNTYFDFEVVFHLMEPSYKYFIERQQKFILDLLVEFEKEEISITNKGEARGLGTPKSNK